MNTPTNIAAAERARQKSTATPTNPTPEQILGTAPLHPHQPIGICIRQTYAALAEATALALEKAPTRLYLKDGIYGTIIEDPANKKYTFHPMEPERLSTWLEEQGIAYYYTLGKTPQPTEKNPHPQPTEIPTSLSPAQAKIILASDRLRFSIPEIKEILPIRLPICHRVADGTYRFTPAKRGYDPATKIYTLDHLPIDWNPTAIWPIQRCVKALLHIFKDFPLDGNLTPHIQSRSMAAIITAMLGLFLHNCIQLFPMIAINANQPGTGKSYCARAILAPFYADLPAGNYIEDDNEMRKYLNTAILEGQTICFLDDITTLSGRVLPRYITITKIKDRILGKQQSFEKENRMQFIVTGNGLKTNKDIERRLLPIDLFTAEDAPTRSSTLTDLKEEHFTNPNWRADILRILWSLTLHWQNAGCPRRAKTLASFKTYTDLCSNIAIHAGFIDPLSPRPINLDTGDTMSAALIELITYIADTILPEDPTRHHTGLTTTYKVSELVDIARQQDLLDIITNAAREPAGPLGRQMRRLNGRRFTDSWGRQFQIGNPTRSVRTAYPFTIYSEPTRTIEQTTDYSTETENPF